jgi:hypothetical protein
VGLSEDSAFFQGNTGIGAMAVQSSPSPVRTFLGKLWGISSLNAIALALSCIAAGFLDSFDVDLQAFVSQQNRSQSWP